MTIPMGAGGPSPPGPGFRPALWGYDREHVDHYVHGRLEELRLLASDRDAAADCVQRLAERLEALRSENDKLRGRLARVCREPLETDGLSERMLHMVELAHEEAADIIAGAEAAAERKRALQRRRARRLRARHRRLLAELQQRRIEQEAEHHELMRRVQSQAQAAAEQAQRQRRELDERATRRRQELERDFAVALAARRDEANKAIAQKEAAARAHAQRLIEQATRRAERIVAEATDRVHALEGMRRRLADELNGARAALADALPLTEPLPEEDTACEEESATLPSPRTRGPAVSSAP